MYRKRNELEQAQALADAERQRKAAEIERKRRQEESERLEQLEAAKKHREEQEQQRKEQEGNYQSQINGIEEEIKSIENSKTDFLTEKLNLAKDHNSEKQTLDEAMSLVLKEKAALIEKEIFQKKKIEEFEARSRSERVALESKQTDAEKRLKELALERRKIQNQMLDFLQKPQKPFVASQPKPTPETTTFTTTALAPALEPTPTPIPTPQPNYSGMPSMGMPSYGNPNPTAPPMQYQPPPMSGMYGQTPYNVHASLAPASYTGPSYPSYPVNLASSQAPGGGANQGSANKPQNDDLGEQLDTLDQLLRDGILSKEEYEANKSEALKAAGLLEEPPKTQQSPPANTSRVSGLETQLEQLDEYLKNGVLGQKDYEDAKNRVLKDAGLLAEEPSGVNTASRPNPASTPAPSAASPTTLVSVQIPANKRPGEDLLISYGGKNYNVKIPAGFRPGMSFQATVPSH